VGMERARWNYNALLGKHRYQSARQPGAAETKQD
jgi:hypothetical protein